MSERVGERVYRACVCVKERDREREKGETMGGKMLLPSQCTMDEEERVRRRLLCLK